MSNTHKDAGNARGLSVRDREIVEYLCKGHSESEAALRWHLSQPRISQIKNSAAGLEYMLGMAQPRRIAVHNIALQLLQERLELVRASGYTVKLETLLAIIRTLEPPKADQSTAEILHAEAERIAEELGLDAEERGKLLQFTRGAA